jgi:hypothetical protein
MKKFLTVAFAFMAMLMIVTPALATCTVGDPSGCNPDSGIHSISDIFALLSKATSWMFVVLLFMAFIFIIMGAFTYISSKGDPKAITLAKNYIIYALIGIVVGVLAKGLILAACSILGATCVLLF